MKKVLLFTAIVAGLGFTSCSKSDECECTISGNTTTYTEDDVTGGVDLEEGCEALDAIAKLGGASGDGCEMK